MHSRGHKSTVFVMWHYRVPFVCEQLKEDELRVTRTRTVALSRMGALINKTHSKGTLIGRRTLNRIIYSVVCKNVSSCRLKFPMKNWRQMSGKSKARDRTNLGTSTAPI